MKFSERDSLLSKQRNFGFLLYKQEKFGDKPLEAETVENPLTSLENEGANINLKNIPKDEAMKLIEAANEELQSALLTKAKITRGNIINLIFDNNHEYASLGMNYTIPNTDLNVSASVTNSGSENLFGASISHEKYGLTAFVSQEYGNMGIDKSFSLPKGNITGTVGIASDIDSPKNPYITGSLDVPLNDTVSIGGYTAIGQNYYEVYAQKQISEKASVSAIYASDGTMNLKLNISF